MKSAIIEAAEALEAITDRLGSHPVMSRDDYSYLCDLAQRLRALQYMPSWDEAPKWAQWLAMDEDGEWFWFEAEPCADDGSLLWARECDTRCERASATRWKSTLQERPK